MEGSSPQMLHVIVAQKWQTAVRLMRTEGLARCGVEICFFLTKPVRLLVEWVIWRMRVAFFGRDGLLEVGANGSRLLVGCSDEGIARELAVYGTHEPFSTRYLAGLVRPGMTVIDIGANVGYYATLEARLVGPLGHVYAVEPVPDNVALLRKNIDSNGLANVEVHECAIGRRSERARMQISRKSNWHTMLPTAWSEGNGIEVSVVSLDDFVRSADVRAVDVVRMDIEGYETVAIEGMEETLGRFHPLVFVELHPHIVEPASIVALVARMGAWGYGVRGLIDRRRDLPMRWRWLRVEKPSIDDLMRDGRILKERKAVSVFFG